MKPKKLHILSLITQYTIAILLISMIVQINTHTIALVVNTAMNIEILDIDKEIEEQEKKETDIKDENREFHTVHPLILFGIENQSITSISNDCMLQKVSLKVLIPPPDLV